MLVAMIFLLVFKKTPPSRCKNKYSRDTRTVKQAAEPITGFMKYESKDGN